MSRVPIRDGAPAIAARRYRVAGDMVVRRSLVDASRIQICWGEGPERRQLTTTSHGLASWLLEVADGSLPSLVSSAAAALAMTRAEAARTVERLRRGRLLVPAGAEPEASEREWLLCNLHDALTFHRATRGTSWTALSPLDPEIGSAGPRGATTAEDEPLDGVSLPVPSAAVSRQEFFRTLHRRRTTRSFASAEIGLQQVSDVLWWSTRSGDGDAPCADDSCALTLYAIFDPEKAPPEVPRDALVCRYDPARHRLLRTGSTDRPGPHSALLSEQAFVDGAPLILVLAINWRRYMRSRSPYTYRRAHLDTGAFMQRTLLIATALGLRTFVTAALDDARFESLLGVDDSVSAPSYIVALGAVGRRMGVGATLTGR